MVKSLIAFEVVFLLTLQCFIYNQIADCKQVKANGRNRNGNVNDVVMKVQVCFVV